MKEVEFFDAHFILKKVMGGLWDIIEVYDFDILGLQK